MTTYETDFVVEHRLLLARHVLQLKQRTRLEDLRPEMRTHRAALLHASFFTSFDAVL